MIIVIIIIIIIIITNKRQLTLLKQYRIMWYTEPPSTYGITIHNYRPDTKAQYKVSRFGCL